ncbi:MAG: hypothetical protein QXY84_03310 [Candidatus Caldarchaeum sp.]
MRVLKVSPLKRFVSVVPETTLDLLNLYRVVDVGDLVYCVTSRELKKERRNGSVDSMRVMVELGVEVADKKLDPMMKRVDFLGVIKYESRELGLVGKHHSIHVSVGDEISIETRKNFPKIEAMAKYYRGTQTAKNVNIILVDDESIAVYSAGGKGLRTLFQKTIVEGKREPEQRSTLLKKLYTEALDKIGGEEDIYVYGPSVLVDEFLNTVKRKKPDVYRRIRKTGYVSTTDYAGLSELLRAGGLSELRETVKTVADVEDVEQLLKILATEPMKAAIGVRESLNALQMNAAEKILLAEDLLWQKIDDEQVASLLDKAESYGTAVRVISSGSEASEKLLSLGGVAALLRFPVDVSVLRQGS